MIREFANYKAVPESIWNWPSFTPREMACKGTGKLLIDSDAMDKLQHLRNKLDAPMIITSAYRSRAHNTRVGGAVASKHMEGIAFDVRMDNHNPQEFETQARSVGFKGFGFYPKSGFMHIDTGELRTWGNRWPETKVQLPVEPPRHPESIKEDKEAKAAAGAGVLGALAVGADYVPVLGKLAPTAQILAILMAAFFIGYILWKRTR